MIKGHSRSFEVIWYMIRFWYSPVEIYTHTAWSLIVNSVLSPHSTSSPSVCISVWVEDWLNQEFNIVLVAGKLTSGNFSDEPLAVCWWDPFAGMDTAIDGDNFRSASDFESDDWSAFTSGTKFFVDDVTKN